LDPQKPSVEPVPGPHTGVRLLWWFGIYFTAQFPLFPYRADYSYFPVGLTFPFLLLADKITGTEILLPAWVRDATYGFYILHLAASLVVRSCKAFRILLWILIAVVLFNLAGCEMGQHAH
jgi:hypothetical protein